MAILIDTTINGDLSIEGNCSAIDINLTDSELETLLATLNSLF